MILAPRMTIITLGVADLVTATKFYEETLGWTKTSNSTDSISFLLSLYSAKELAEDANINGPAIDVSPGGTQRPFRGFTLAYCTSSEEEVNEIFVQLRIKGVTIVKEPEKAFWGGYSGYMADPDHNLWEIAYNPYLSMDHEGKVV